MQPRLLPYQSCGELFHKQHITTHKYNLALHVDRHLNTLQMTCWTRYTKHASMTVVTCVSVRLPAPPGVKKTWNHSCNKVDTAATRHGSNSRCMETRYLRQMSRMQAWIRGYYQKELIEVHVVWRLQTQPTNVQSSNSIMCLRWVAQEAWIALNCKRSLPVTSPVSCDPETFIWVLGWDLRFGFGWWVITTIWRAKASWARS